MILLTQIKNASEGRRIRITYHSSFVCSASIRYSRPDGTPLATMGEPRTETFL